MFTFLRVSGVYRGLLRLSQSNINMRNLGKWQANTKSRLLNNLTLPLNYSIVMDIQVPTLGDFSCSKTASSMPRPRIMPPSYSARIFQ
jgi:hypothetical protein